MELAKSRLNTHYYPSINCYIDASLIYGKDFLKIIIVLNTLFKEIISFKETKPITPWYNDLCY